MNLQSSTTNPTVARIAPSTWIALAALALGWFWLATLVSTFGPIQQLVHFYDMGTVLRDPSWLVHGMGSHGLGVFAFGLLSAVILLAPIFAHRLRTRPARLLYLLPLAFIVLCGVILYSETSQPYVTASSSTGMFGAFAARVANDVIGRGADTIARHISVGAGGYLSLLAALFLAYQGLQQFVAFTADSSSRGQPPQPDSRRPA